MLRTLSIRDVVLVERLDLSFHNGLCVLTGETGAGKSILLDALGLALGTRADSRLVRHGAAQAVVVAEFDLPDSHPVVDILAEQALVLDGGTLLLRRVVGGDGRSRAFVNDQSVGLTLLKKIGETLVEIHGQFESQRLMNPANHRELLDAFGGLGPQVSDVAEACRTWRSAKSARQSAAEDMARARAEEDFLRHSVEEIAVLDPYPGEETELSERRLVMMHGEKLIQAMNAAMAELSQGRGVEHAIQAATRELERVASQAEGRLAETIQALDRAAADLTHAQGELERLSADLDLDPRTLEQSEERLFALRALARKHGVEVDSLPALREEMAAKLAALEDESETLKRLERNEKDARERFGERVRTLRVARAGAARSLDAAVASELAPLRLGKATFVTEVLPLTEGDWNELGGDRVVFAVSTNPGTPPGPLNKIASGGELSRFMLALKVVLAQADPVPTLVFDEVDSGIGGAVASAVGQRLAVLGRDLQVLVVTHSPQVAALGTHHWRVSKVERDARVETTVDSLTSEARREEIARMLAGARVTEEARAAAESLMRGSAL